MLEAEANCVPVLIEAARRLGPGRHHLIASSGALGVPAAPLWLLVLIVAVLIAAVGLYWSSTRSRT